jgi:hypothetical protein
LVPFQYIFGALEIINFLEALAQIGQGIFIIGLHNNVFTPTLFMDLKGYS